MEFRIAKASVLKNSFVGLFLKTNNEVTFAPHGLPKKNAVQAREVLGTRVAYVLIDQSPLIGLLLALNSSGVVLPCYAEKSIAELFKKEGLNVLVLREPLAPGNLIACNDRAALASPLIPKEEAKRIGDALGVEVFQQALAGNPAVGATCVATNNGVLAFNEASEIELRLLEKIFRVKAVAGTTNFGSECNALGVIANDRGALVGEATTGFEIQRVFEAFNAD
ncbi:MAG: translation initiation factor IF-6 [Candidatus Norongarragalinales archaeon]